jgi:hypothetical protein
MVSDVRCRFIEPLEFVVVDKAVISKLLKEVMYVSVVSRNSRIVFSPQLPKYTSVAGTEVHTEWK